MNGGADVDVVSVDVIPLPAGGVVFKRGIHEVALNGDNLGTIIGPLGDILRNPGSRADVLGALPDDEREVVENALGQLAERGISTDVAPGVGAAPTPAQQAFYADFGALGAIAPARLRDAKVAIYGDNAISSATVATLHDLGCTNVTLVPHPGLSSGDGGDVADDGFAGADLVCATSDVGEVDALLDVNRAAVAAGTPFVASWLSNLQGYVGPLVYPGETACLRCYQLRTESHNGNYETARTVRRHISASAARRIPAALPPMTGVLAQILAMEIAKALGGFAPSDIVARSVQVNLVSLRMTSSRVLKVPRCPDCGDSMSRSPEVIIVGPQITE